MHKPKQTCFKLTLLCLTVSSSGHALGYSLDLGLAGDLNVFGIAAPSAQT